MTRTTDASLSKRSREGTLFSVSFTVPLASLAATTDVITKYPILEPCTPVLFTATATVVATTASRDADLVLHRIPGDTNTNADITAVKVFDSCLKLTTATQNALGETRSKTISNDLVFQPEDTFSIYCLGNPTAAFAEGTTTLTVWFRRV